MCGIVGYTGKRQAAEILLDGLARLEYRGYDSAGVAVAGPGASLSLVRAVGKLARLRERLIADLAPGTVGLGHTRWATHGAPSESNAHPHPDCTGRLAVVHNGIIENHAALRAALSRRGHLFRSQTDTEVVSHLIEETLAGLVPSGSLSGTPPEALLLEACRAAFLQLQGAYALGVLWESAPGFLVAAKHGSPLILALGEGETFLASDVPAFVSQTRKVIFLDDGELALLSPAGVVAQRLDGREITKPVTVIDWEHGVAEKGGFRHFMLKEIHEQPSAVENTLRGRLLPLNDGILLRESGLSPEILPSIKRVHIVACGTACHAGIIGKYLLERFTRLPVQVEAASEFRYREPILDPSTLVVAISQSGETADTLAAMRLAKEQGAKVLAICNTVGSAVARNADFNFYTRCGPECGVASTKAFVGQLVALYCLTLHLGLALGRIPPREGQSWVEQLAALPALIRRALALGGEVEKIAGRFAESRHFLFIGRTFNYPTALEGALKLKEISYIHAEGYAAGEMKHGPLALIDSEMPVVAIATHSEVFDKIVSNIEEARARGARIIAVCNEGETRLDGKADALLRLPRVGEFLSPVLNIIPLQLLAYHIADLRGCDVDQPRNLAKSVTVE
jgi:glutamine---fructose-6-phosphate transaminase (isomerizing)